MHVLITGGAGFLGANLCRRLLAAGHTACCLDDFSTGSADNLTGIAGSDRLQVVRANLVDGVPQGARPDVIYNLACPASPPQYQRDPIQTLKTSVWGAMHVLDLARQTGAVVLQASTSEVYGDPTEHPQTESYRGNVNPIGPRACYDEGKRAAETLFFDYQRCHGVRIRVARIFNTYGPHMHPEDGRVVSNFIVQALRGQPLSLYGEGHQTRSFCYVDDLIDGLVALTAAPDTVTGPVNLGNPSEFTVRQLAEEVMRLTEVNLPLETRPLPKDDPTQRRPDIRQAQALLGWTPKVGLQDGLTRTIAYFRQRLATPT